MNVKAEVNKASSPEPSYLFRPDDNYNIGDAVGFEKILRKKSSYIIEIANKALQDLQNSQKLREVS
ncbi:MAG: hypothetical protein V7K38_21055 [Nostoc sp.]|uniref:hypothetical protein n=1 Tax=Nostoc sp. TaxID=1180 RepID=UPI002FF7DBBB